MRRDNVAEGNDRHTLDFAGRVVLPRRESTGQPPLFGGWLMVIRADRTAQAREGLRRMPRRHGPKKDAASSEMLWGAAGTQRSRGVRMGQPLVRQGTRPRAEHIGQRREPRELKHLSTARRREEVPQ